MEKESDNKIPHIKTRYLGEVGNPLYHIQKWIRGLNAQAEIFPIHTANGQAEIFPENCPGSVLVLNTNIRTLCSHIHGGGSICYIWHGYLAIHFIHFAHFNLEV